MRTFTLEETLRLPLSPEELFPFFTDVHNLEAITPPWLHFRVLRSSTKDIQLGTEIDYETSLLESGFKFRNPNVAEACGCGESIKFKDVDELSPTDILPSDAPRL